MEKLGSDREEILRLSLIKTKPTVSRFIVLSVTYGSVIFFSVVALSLFELTPFSPLGVFCGVFYLVVTVRLYQVIGAYLLRLDRRQGRLVVAVLAKLALIALLVLLCIDYGGWFFGSIVLGFLAFIPSSLSLGRSIEKSSGIY